MLKTPQGWGSELAKPRQAVSKGCLKEVPDIQKRLVQESQKVLKWILYLSKGVKHCFLHICLIFCANLIPLWSESVFQVSKQLMERYFMNKLWIDFIFLAQK